MPVYDYKCSQHGIFYELATMENHAQPASCPQCQQLSPRVIIMAPEVLDMSPLKKQAIETNEKAQHQPQFSTTDSRAENADRLKHGCGCRHEKRPSKLIYTAEGNKMFPSMRPWMISH
jgi:putative FmdB family regulatory protein